MADFTGTAGNDSLIGSNANDNLFGLDGNDTLLGLAGDDLLDGGNGNDLLDGGSGIDTLIGGAGNDTYVVDSLFDVITETNNAGTDTVQALIDYTLGANLERLTLLGVTVNGTGNTLNNTITGNAVNNILSGLDGNDTLLGLDGIDTLIGENGNDFLDGGTGTDSLEGGTGNDTYVVDNAADAVVEADNAGTDTVRSSINYILGTNLENLILTGSAVNGTGNTVNNSITGNNANNFLAGLEGNDTLNGGNGIDTLDGGVGSDTYIVNTTTDTIIEAKVSDTGIDTVQSSVTYTLGANLENLTLTGSAAIDGTGNELNNVLTGNNANNTLTGLDGNDTLIGGNGNDSLFGQFGDDNLDGGAGNDYLDSGEGLNVLTGGTGDDTYVTNGFSTTVIEAANAGLDSVISFTDYTLADNLENLSLVNNAIVGTGNELNNVINGNDVNNILDGAAGIDTLNGGGGDDTYSVDNLLDVVNENANAGIDTVNTSTVDYILGVNLENLILVGDAINGTGNSLDNTITGNALNNTLSGLEGRDILNSGDGNDSLLGGANNDTLNGGAGNDTLDGGLDDGFIGLQTSEFGDQLFGGLGNDIYIVDNRADLVTEDFNQGIDTVQASASNYALTSNVENLTLIGNATTGFGNNLANTLRGNALINTLSGLDGNDFLFGESGNDNLSGGNGEDILDGGTGNDFLNGGLGNDIYLLNDISSDIVFEEVNAGIDTVVSVFDSTLSANVEHLFLQGNALAGTGNTLNNLLSGNALGNTLSGLDGFDTLNGFDGSDFLDGGNNNDNIFGGNGNDFILGGEGNDLINGDNDNDNIFGGNGDDLIQGGLGNDAISGQAGFDTLTGGGGADSFRFHTPFEGTDNITDFSVADDTITVFATSFGAGLIAGAPLQDSRFSLGSSTAILSTSIRFIYDANNGGLFFDPNGGNSGDRTQLATLSPLLAFSAADIFVAL